MSDYVIDGEILTDIADAIREKTGESGVIIPEDMPDAIADISGGGSLDISLIDGESYTTSEINLTACKFGDQLPDGFYVYNFNQFRLKESIVKDLGQTDTNFTIYYYARILEVISGGSPRILEVNYANTTYQNCMFYMVNSYIGYSTYFTDTTTNIEWNSEHCYAAKCDLVNNVASFFVDGVKLGELQIVHTGRYVSFNGYLNTNLPSSYPKYAAVVEGVQSDSKIIENMQTIMNHYAA